MTRVIAGAAGGRRLSVPSGNSTRPTSDRAREGLFGTVLSELGSLEGRSVLDLYAGSGAVGLEALSRGAVSVTFVESDVRAAGVIKANVKTVGLPGTSVVISTADRFLAGPPGTGEDRVRDGQRGPYDLVFADPPYAVTAADIAKLLTLLHAGRLAPGALVVVERATRSGVLEWPPGYMPGKSRRYGEATFWYAWYEE
ncbi:MAG TPA: 16S rRNA (guanine(966)-N(2))-methyltransferase RsmD [Trebonia sp.]